MVKLPYEMKVGRKKVFVRTHARNGRRIHGCYHPEVGTMEVYLGHELRPRPDAAVRTTFWHELTHAVLFEMGDKLATNEAFVTEFARLLSGAIETARFAEDGAFGAPPLKAEGARIKFDAGARQWPKKKK